MVDEQDANEMYPQSTTDITEKQLDKLVIIEEFKKLKGVGASRAEKLIDAGYLSIE